MPIPVICDRCRTTGHAGSGDFSHFGDLLEFDPVPRRPRVNGWDPEAQRAFIALLATTGSKCRAATAIGRNAFGVDQLLKAPGNDSFKLAYDRAMAIAARNGSMKIAQGVADAAARNAQLTPPSRLRGLPPPQEEEDDTDDQQRTLATGLFRKFLLKVQAERTARLEGKVAAADFYLRQITFFEIAIDLSADGLGLDGFELLATLRRDGQALIDIAETPMSRLLDERRRALWAMMADPNRPEHPPVRYLVDHNGHSTEPLDVIHGGEDHATQQARYEERYADEAKAQAEWEASARSHAGVHGEHEAESAKAKPGECNDLA